MEIGLSYFGYIKNLNKDDKLVSIARYLPRWLKNMNISEYKDLAPSEKLLWFYKKNKVNEEDYIRIYTNETLAKLDANKVYNDLVKLGVGYKRVVLLCYETPVKFCHRFICGEWLCNQIEEIENIKECGIY